MFQLTQWSVQFFFILKSMRRWCSEMFQWKNIEYMERVNNVEKEKNQLERILLYTCYICCLVEWDFFQRLNDYTCDDVLSDSNNILSTPLFYSFFHYVMMMMIIICKLIFMRTQCIFLIWNSFKRVFCCLK